MKKPPIRLKDAAMKQRAIQAILEAADDEEMIIRTAGKEKTLEQLGGIFGAWAKYISDQTGMSVHEVHTEWKGKFLWRIYAEDPRGKHQEMWAAAYYKAWEGGNPEMCAAIKGLVSLSWAQVKQAKEYMNQIDQYYMSAGMPLPMLERK
jgi:hypothetical protein